MVADQQLRRIRVEMLLIFVPRFYRGRFNLYRLIFIFSSFMNIKTWIHIYI